MAEDFASDPTWPALSRAATDCGLRAMFASPLRSGAVKLGALTLSRDAAGDLDPQQYTDALNYARLALDLLDELNTMVDGLAAIARVDATHAQHAPIDLTVNGDTRDLTLAVSALIDNAVKYAPAGPITTTLTVSDEVAPAASVRVCDSGPGVSRNELGQLFQRFFRSPDARGLPGSGLGLALVDRLTCTHTRTAHAEICTPHGYASLSQYR